MRDSLSVNDREYSVSISIFLYVIETPIFPFMGLIRRVFSHHVFVTISVCVSHFPIFARNISISAIVFPSRDLRISQAFSQDFSAMLQGSGVSTMPS